MSSQNIDIEEPFIDQTMSEDQQSKGAFNAIYKLVINQSNDPDNPEPNPTRIATSFLPDEPVMTRKSPPATSNLLFSRNEVINDKEPTKSRENMVKSREIHRQLLNKKNRWKPSELELTVLKLHFGKNKYPSKEEKEEILKNLEENFQSVIGIGQINRWFQHEREKGQRYGHSMSKNTYRKFGKDDLDFLKKCFAKNTYPKVEEMTDMANKLNVTLSKIENWFKHNRRSLAKKGNFTLKTKKYFKKNEVSYLMKMFDTYPRPTKEQITEMADHLACSELQIKNWYSNKRKKQKLVAKRQSIGNQETRLHFGEASIIPQSQFASQPTELLNALPLTNPNSTPIIPIATFPQVTEPNTILPGLIPNRPVNTFPVQQLPTAIPANGMFANGQFINGGYPNGMVPVFIIPSTPSNMPLNQSGININTNNMQPIQEAEIKGFPQNNLQNQQALFNKNSIPKSQPLPQSLPNNMTPMMAYNAAIPQQTIQPSIISQMSTPYTPFKQNGFQQNPAEIPAGTWINPGQAIQSSNPIIILNGNTPQTFQVPQMAFNMQGQPTNFGQNTFISGGMMPNKFQQNGNCMPGAVSYEQPLQIQYMTSLYCPYSNNNIFSNYYPIVVQNGSNYTVQQNSGKPFGMEAMMPNTIQINPQQTQNNLIQMNQRGMNGGDLYNGQKMGMPMKGNEPK